MTKPRIELISSVPHYNSQFLQRNYSEAEIGYCQKQPDPAASFAARWAAKEAVFKSMGTRSQGAAAAMKDIEITTNEDGKPSVRLHGEASKAALTKGIVEIHVSMSHSEV